MYFWFDFLKAKYNNPKTITEVAPIIIIFLFL